VRRAFSPEAKARMVELVENLRAALKERIEKLDWMGPEALRVRLNTDPHSPGRFRVIGPLTGMPEFYQAFACEPGSAMVRAPEVRTSIW